MMKKLLFNCGFVYYSGVQANVDCIGAWTAWSYCDRSCDTGIKTRTWKITQQKTGSGK